jgi:probable F420-dependent oxidoreductase
MTKVIVHPGLTDHTLDPVQYGHRVAERGLHGIYLPEHTHIPVDYLPSDYPQNQEMPDRYRRILDPFVALSFIAATTDLEVGTCISLVGQHDPIALAKQIATLDRLSGGRFVFGVGFGWNTREFANHSPVPPARRPEVVREHVELMSTLWAEDVASYAGEHVSLSPSWAWPKPIQRPRPPVLLGGRAGKANFTRIATWADGWITLTGYLEAPEYPAHLARLRSIWTDHGRPPEELRVMALEEPGPPGTVRRLYERARELELDRFVLHVEDRPADVVLPILDEMAEVVARN